MTAMLSRCQCVNRVYLSTGFGCSFMVLVASNVSMGNFSPKHRGLIVGGTGAFFFIGPLLFGLIYATGFSKIPLGNFFLCLSVCMIVVNILAIFFVRHVPSVAETATEETDPVENMVSFVDIDDISDNWRDRIGISQFVLPSFQLLTWAFMFEASVQMLYFANVTIYIDSYRLHSLYYAMPIVGPAFGAVFTFAGGMVSDRTMRYTSRLTYLIVGVILQTIFFFISMEFGNNYYVFIITTLVLYSNNGQVWSIVPALISEYFGLLYFTRNWGLLLMVNALIALALGYIFAWFYEEAISNDSTTCFGLKCFVNSYLLAACFSLVSVILFIVLYILERRQRIITATVVIDAPNPVQEHDTSIDNTGYGTIQWQRYSPARQIIHHRTLLCVPSETCFLVESNVIMKICGITKPREILKLTCLLT